MTIASFFLASQNASGASPDWPPNEIRPSARGFYYRAASITLRLHLRSLSSSERGRGSDLVKEEKL